MKFLLVYQEMAPYAIMRKAKIQQFILTWEVNRGLIPFGEDDSYGEPVFAGADG